MECFENFIGIESCEGVTPISGKYLVDGGISRRELDLFAGSDYEDGLQLGNAKIKHSIEFIKNDFYLKFNSKFKGESILDGARVGHYEENLSTYSAYTGKRGIALKLLNKSSFLSIYLQKIELFTDYTGDVTVSIYDVYQNKVLDTVVVTCVANEVSSAWVEKTYKIDKKNVHLAVLYDTTGIQQYKSYVNKTGCKHCEVDKYVECGTYVTSKGVQIENGQNVIDSNLKGTGHTGGISLMYSVNCNHENFICLHKNMLILPIIYKASSEICTYALYQTERLNYANIDVEQLKERRDFYEMNYREQMSNILSNIDVPKDSICFDCKNRIVSRRLMP